MRNHLIVFCDKWQHSVELKGIKKVKWHHYLLSFSTCFSLKVSCLILHIRFFSDQSQFELEFVGQKISDYSMVRGLSSSLIALTVCLWINTNRNSGNFILSYTTTLNSNELLISQDLDHVIVHIANSKRYVYNCYLLLFIVRD